MTAWKVARVIGSKRAAVSLALILIATSAAFAVTSSILLSVDHTAAGMLGETPDTIVVAQANSRAPFLGTLPLGLAGSLESIPGVRVVSPEVFAPSTIDGRPVMVRGVDPPSFMELQKPKILDGSLLAANDTTDVMVGAVLASQMGLTPGSQVTIVGGVRATIAQVTVKGVFSTGTPLDNEVVSPLWVGDWLRGLSYGTVSILRVAVPPGQAGSNAAIQVERVAGASSTGASGNSSVAEPGLPVSSNVDSFAGHVVEASPDVSASFFSKTVGLSRENVLLISALVFVSMSVAIVCALQEAVFRSRNEFGTMRTIGMSSRRLSLDLVFVATGLGLLASLIGLLAGFGFLTLVDEFSPVEIAFYAVDPRVAFGAASLYSGLVVTAAAAVAAVIASLRFRRSLEVYSMTVPYMEAAIGEVDE